MFVRKQGDTYILREEVPGESAIFSGSIPSEFEKSYKEFVAKGNTSIITMIDNISQKYPKSIAIQEKTATGYKEITYEELVTKSKQLAKALLDGNFCPDVTVDGKILKFLGAFMTGRSEFVFTDLAAFFLGAVAISLFEDPYDHLLYIINSSDFETVVISPDYAKMFVKLIKEKSIRHIKNFILTEDLDAETIKGCKDLGINTFSFSSIIEKGKESKRELPKIEPDMPGATMVTSGSTGYPKAALIKHSSLLFLHMGNWPKMISHTDSILANINYAFGTSKLSIMLVLSRGGKVIFFGNKPELTLQVMRETNPTIAIFPPIFLHKIHAKALETINGLPTPQKEGLLKAITMKIGFMKAKGEILHPELDKHLLPFGQKMFGTGLRHTFFIGAQCKEDTLWFFRAILGCPMYNLYGQTECGSWCHYSKPTSPADSVGFAVPGFECKVVDWKEGGYSNKDKTNGKPTPRGELWLKGLPILAGYLKDMAKYKEIITADGWLRTHDIVQLNPEDMSIKIIDRFNNVIKLSNEEFITVELLEKIYEESQFIAQIYVHAAPDKDYLVAVAVPKPETIIPWAKAKGLPADFASLCKNEELQTAILIDLRKIAQAKTLNSYEHIRKIYLSAEPFTQTNGLITFSFKLRRNNIKEKFKSVIDGMYALH